MIRSGTATLALWTTAWMATAIPCAAADWNQFRGPGRDGISSESGLARSWGDSGPPELWRVEVGPGFSAIAVVGERLYTLDSDEKGEYARAFDARTGEALWKRPIGGLFQNNYGDGPRSGPTVDGDRVFVLSSLGELHALDAASGETAWHVSFTERFGSQLPRWAFASAPLVLGDQLIVEVGGTGERAIASFDKATGEVRWTAHEGAIAYSSPIVVDAAGARQVVFSTQAGLHGLSPRGELLWRSPFVPKLGIKPAPPVFVAPDLVFVSASYDAGAKTVRLRQSEDGGVSAEEVWSGSEMRNHFNGSVALDGHVVGFDKGTLKCLDPRTGEVRWAHRGLGKGSLIRTDDLLILLSERGELVLAEANVEAFRELAAHQVLTGRSWTQPTLADGRVYVRNGSEMAAFDLRAGK